MLNLSPTDLERSVGVFSYSSSYFAATLFNADGMSKPPVATSVASSLVASSFGASQKAIADQASVEAGGHQGDRSRPSHRLHARLKNSCNHFGIER